MSTYSAWLVTQRGHPRDALQLKTGLPIPTQVPEGHVLLKVQAVALNPAGYKLMAAVPNFLAGRPHVAEIDVTGIVVDPNGASGLSAGDRAFGTATPKSGVLAEYVVLPAARLVPVPPSVSAVEAAGLGGVVATAYQGLTEHLHIEPGQTVLVNGGSSAVGLAAIQIAKSMGCKVVATASGKNRDLLLSLGADEFIDYTESPLAARLLANPPSPKFHAIFDAVGLTDPTLYLHCAAYLAPGGVYLTAGTLPKTAPEWVGMLRQLVEGFLRPVWLGGVPRKYAGFIVHLEKNDLETVRDLVASGTVKPLVDSVHSFDRDGVLRAYDRIMSQRAVGKVVVKVAD
ncbi:hypothetical protein DFH06DRAFT_1442816 [Mycena polygramma]|nr:hypothetical protein DFH06DRAFT_1442816 [Mycena polygramma]